MTSRIVRPLLIISLILNLALILAIYYSSLEDEGNTRQQIVTDSINSERDIRQPHWFRPTSRKDQHFIAQLDSFDHGRYIDVPWSSIKDYPLSHSNLWTDNGLVGAGLTKFLQLTEEEVETVNKVISSRIKMVFESEAERAKTVTDSSGARWIEIPSSEDARELTQKSLNRETAFLGQDRSQILSRFALNRNIVFSRINDNHPVRIRISEPDEKGEAKIIVATTWKGRWDYSGAETDSLDSTLAERYRHLPFP